MANMSYCRFSNTFEDLADCLYAVWDSIRDEKPIQSNSEKQRMFDMVRLCEDYIEAISEYEEIFEWTNTKK